MSGKKSKLYCYADETGQDTAGRFFTVSVLITEAERNNLLKQLELIEEESGKKNIKWKKSRPKSRKAYIEEISRLAKLKHSLFVATYYDSKDYLANTADALAKSLRKKSGLHAIIYVDALSESQQPKLKRQLRSSVKIPIQVRGIRREENNAFIRLVDAICGLVRDADEGRQWAKTIVRRLKRNNVLENL